MVVLLLMLLLQVKLFPAAWGWTTTSQEGCISAAASVVRFVAAGFWRRDPGSRFPWEADVRFVEVVMERFQFTRIPLRLPTSGERRTKTKPCEK